MSFNPLYIGITEEIDSNESRRLILVNVLTIIGISVNLIYFTFLFAMEKFLISTFNLTCGIVLGFFGIYFMHSKRYNIAKVFNLLSIPACLIVFSFIYGDLNVNLIFLMFVISAFFVLENKKTIFVVVTWNFAIILFINIGLATKFLKPIDNEIAYWGHIFYWSNLIIGFLCNVVMLGIFKTENLRYEKSLHRRNKLISKQKEMLEVSNTELQDKNDEVVQQNEEIQSQRDELMNRNLKIDQQNKELSNHRNNIVSSLMYASRIQNAVLPPTDLVEQILPNHFILYKPRDIVSGDFYYVKQMKQYTIIAVADCTGHGVPGAFMSMLGITLLNEIIRNSENNTSAKLLNELRKQVKIALGQSGQRGEQRDGMDIAFCSINIETNELNFAGANCPLWIFRSNPEQIGLGECMELTANRMPVGVYAKEHPFSEHAFQLQPGDAIYLFSDGFNSQFGGEKNEKFKARRFKEVLFGIHHLPMNEQKKQLETEFTLWKNENDQTDDVLVLGVRV